MGPNNVKSIPVCRVDSRTSFFHQRLQLTVTLFDDEQLVGEERAMDPDLGELLRQPVEFLVIRSAFEEVRRDRVERAARVHVEFVVAHGRLDAPPLPEVRLVPLTVARLVDRARALPRRGDEGRRALGLALEEARQRRERRLLAGGARRERRDEERERATAPGGGHALSSQPCCVEGDW